MHPTVLHVAPHPDDEILGCGATLLALRAAGWRVVNLACSLGRPADHARRRAELEAALGVLGVEGVVADPPVALSSRLEPAGDEREVARLVERTAADLGADLLLSPHPEDGHPSHALVGRAVASVGAGTRWWAWAIWRDLPEPNRYVPYGEADMARLVAALRGHAGELARQPYLEVLAARARVQAVLGSERVMGFGSGPASAEPYADLIEERVRSAGAGWRLAAGPTIGVGEGPLR
jgi:LmbE family N-acetylglucosaminyl deacetylase